MTRKSLVDELAELRAEIVRLKARAERIETTLILNPDLRVGGTWHLAELSETRQRLLDIQRLPVEIHRNPELWREMIQRSISLIPHDRAHRAERTRLVLNRSGNQPLH